MSTSEEMSTAARSLCADCGVVHDEEVTGCRRTEHGWLCDDCYFCRLGELVEQRPVRS